jgi:hypothetical protein
VPHQQATERRVVRIGEGAHAARRRRRGCDSSQRVVRAGLHEPLQRATSIQKNGVVRACEEGGAEEVAIPEGTALTEGEVMRLAVALARNGDACPQIQIQIQ